MCTGYEPLNTLKPIGADIWLVDGPHIRFSGMPFSTRAMIVRLENGDIWVHSPTFLTDALAGEVEALGPVRHLVAPNWIHYAYVTEWQTRFPDASAWAAPGVKDRALKYKMDVQFDHDLGQEPPEEWAGQIDQMIVRGSNVHREAVFFHRASRTLILTDIIENFEAANIPWYLRIATKLGRVQAPDGQMPFDMRQTFRKGRAELRQDIERMIAWAPTRVIIAHGRWFAENGVAELKRAFRWLL